MNVLTVHDLTTTTTATTMVMDTVAVAEISVTISTAPPASLPSPSPLTRCIFVRGVEEAGRQREGIVWSIGCDCEMDRRT